MKIQVVTFSGKETAFQSNNIVLNSLHDMKSPDDFDIVAIMLNDEHLWENDGPDDKKVNAQNDLKSIQKSISESKRCMILIGLPQNYYFKYNHVPSGFRAKKELKDNIKEYRENILAVLSPGMKNIELLYENTQTVLGDKSVSASFAFIHELHSALKSTSGKSVARKEGNSVYTTLNIKDSETLMMFLRAVDIVAEKEEMPAWIKELEMFDDVEQIDLIRARKSIISKAKEEIEEAEKQLDKNNWYKSALYKSGDELVEVVFDILHEMIGADFSDFIDEKKEDFNIELNGWTLIGEIKGVSHNVKSENVSQLEVHYQSYLEEHPDVDEDSVAALLIMAAQNKKPLSQRDPVHETQIKLAKRNGSLIIETYELLKMFQKYKKGKLERNECFKLLTEKNGILLLGDSE